jgi:prenylcysteine oxidase/farnesylcysteine lyase
VKSISHRSSSRLWTVESTHGALDYKAVILAAPFHSTNITLPPALSAQIPEQPYVRLHVTLLTTTSPAPNSTYFSSSPSSKVPLMMLTTYEGASNGGEEPEFNSLSYHGLVRDGEWAVKIFSQKRISDEWLDMMFPGKVGWVYRKEVSLTSLRCNVYNVCFSGMLIPNFLLQPCFLPSSWTMASTMSMPLNRRSFYLLTLLPKDLRVVRFISTMETETIASRNVVDLLLNEEFNSGVCGSRISASETTKYRTSTNNEDFVIGWDC